ncbi:MAG: DNA recombination protein RmuC [Armatimonadota bacterium]
MEAVWLMVGLAVGLTLGGLLVWVWMGGRVSAVQGAASELRAQLDRLRQDLEDANSQITEAQTARAAAETRCAEALKNVREQQSLLDDAKAALSDTFKALSTDALQASNRQFLELAKQTLEARLKQAEGDLEKRQQAVESLVSPLREALKNYDEQIRAMEKRRQEAYGSLEEQLRALGEAHQQLQRETTALVHALRTPQVRGRWGEITLRRVVEIAGMSQHCDFDEQATTDTEEGRMRPDLVVHLPEGRTIVVDAKAPLSAYMDAMEASNDAERADAMKRHAQGVHQHVRTLGSRAYQDQLSPSPDFVVLFLPGESFFSAALEQDKDLIEAALHNRVLLATPTTLIALLRTVAMTWHQQQVIENAEEIARVSREFFERVAKFSEHLTKVRDGLQRAARAYNEAVGSWERRVLPQGRRLAELGGAPQEAEAPELQPVDVALRELPAMNDADVGREKGGAAEDEDA